MARYGLDYYSGKDFPLSYYGSDAAINFSAYPFTALSYTYGKCILSWTTPIGAWAKLVIVRNKFGYPVNNTDGVIVFTTTRGVDPGYFEEATPNSIPQIYYYSIFVLETTQLQWVLAGQASAMSVANFGTADKLYEYMPEIYKIVEPYNASSSFENKDLKNFLSLFGFQFDQIKCYAELSLKKYDTTQTPGPLIPPLLSQFGIKYEPEIGYQQNRILLRDSIFIQKKKGSRDGLKDYVKGFTGWGLTEYSSTLPNSPINGITVSHNVMLNYNDSSFEESLGNWDSPNDSAVLKEVLKKEITDVAITSGNVRLKIGANNYSTGDKVLISGFDSRYSLMNNDSVAVTLIGADTDSIFYTTSNADMTLRSAWNPVTESYPIVRPYPEPWLETTTPTLFRNKQNGILKVQNASASQSELQISCGDTSPITLGVPVKTGFNYTFSIYSSSNTASRSLVANIKWYDRFGVLVSTTSGTPVNNATGAFNARPTVTDRAPTKLFLNSFTSTAGTGYTNGNYTNVELVADSGKVPTINPRAAITVFGGAVIGVNITDGGAGADTTTVLKVNGSTIGNGSGFKVTVQRCQETYYAVPSLTISNVAGSASNEYHYFDCAQFEQADAVTSFDDARTIHLTMKANRINELVNPKFGTPTTPWSVTNATTTINNQNPEPNIEFYQVINKRVESGTATLTLNVIHTYKTGDSVVITNMGSPFNGAKTLTSAGDATISFAVTGGNVVGQSATGQVYRQGTSMSITPTSYSNQVVLKASTTSADYMGIYYPDTAYTFSIYAQTAGGTSETVVPYIYWYNSNKTLISYLAGDPIVVNAASWGRASVSSVAPSTAAYADVQLVWVPAGSSGNIYVDSALFENSPFVLDYFDGNTGYSNIAELIWEGGNPDAGRSHYYKNRVSIQNRLHSGVLNEYVGQGSTYALYLGQPKT
jgi:hypothetical protein